MNKILKESYSLLSFILIILLASPLSAEQPKPEKKYPNIKPWGFIQGWAVSDETSGPTEGETYDIARLRLGLKGDLSPQINYFVLSEWGRLTFEDPATLLDLWAMYKFDPRFNIRAGQFYYLFTLSGETPIPQIPFVFRPEVIDAIWLPMGRKGTYSYDRGIEFSGNFKKQDVPLSYALSVTTGSGLDSIEDNGKKDLVGRVFVEPFKGWKMGVSGFSGYSTVDVASQLTTLTKELPEYAYGADISYTHKYFRVIYENLQAVYTGYSEGSGAGLFSENTKEPRGWYAMLGIKPVEWLEFPLQYAWYEKDATRSDTGQSTFTSGVTWYFKKGTWNNLKINYMVRDVERNFGANLDNKFIAQLQFVF